MKDPIHRPTPGQIFCALAAAAFVFCLLLSLLFWAVGE